MKDDEGREATHGAGKILSVNISENKGVAKTPKRQGRVLLGHGLEGDAHAADWHRQVSLLANESIEKMVSEVLDVGPGDFGENLTTEGIDLVSLSLGTVLGIGSNVRLEVSQIGKKCHDRCAIYYRAGDCVMPREGVFAVVRKPGVVGVGDEIAVLETPLNQADDSLVEIADN